MTSIGNTKTLFFFTSPRTPIKMIDEIELLVNNFEGQNWNPKTQESYALTLKNSNFFEGKIKNNLSFAARDRINRAPKALGFVNLKPIELTNAGARLLSNKRINEIFIRQMMKFQLPSPYHTDNSGRFYVRPYLEILRLIYELDGLTKHELAIFGLQIIHIDYYELIKTEIQNFRLEKSKKFYTRKKEYIQESYIRAIEKIYADEINQKNFKTRETDNNDYRQFINTKRRNIIDYADAAIRYLKATELVSFDVNSLKLTITHDKKDDVKFLLDNVPREPVYINNENEFKNHLFDANNIILYTDNKEETTKKIFELYKYLYKKLPKGFIKKVRNLHIEELKDLKDKLEQDKIDDVLNKQINSLKVTDDFNDIINVYDSIIQGEVADPPLIFEWNTWRALVILDDGNINGNFKIDTDGSPLFSAPPKYPDISCYYNEFNLIVEVTLSYGEKQYDMESEPVPRHLGDFSKSSDKESFCLFIAKNVSEGTLAYFYGLNNIEISYYGGKSKIIPMDLNSFKAFLHHANEKDNIESNQLHSYLKYLIEQTNSTENEIEWYKTIKNTVTNWTEVISN
ncbi:Restriction endonuclease, type II, AlwI [Methanohalobium evestigatum Z-7303]|uniref:Restriction endonuclease, type II, AlwI n=1 Tax=Methanohalobium evestigatum (strain ATCC BAA-1072 / DSM 3721 / NBRC 107634 / OCM 161 / Z-7303) TaxID=644295 RepID=D7E6P1_METEZ|nr:AlwI family type II restriction endonuclease [Methanohalobium evestigatum]ADI73263.1 Restriction endonuclease, type II, AlwI [Methanohalobium evestigatum Z-7303]